MHLVQARLVGLGPLDDITFRFADDAGVPRKTAVVLGGGGVGKTTLVGAIASTRPGHAVAQRPRRPGEVAYAVIDWALGAEDPARPHTLRIAGPNAVTGEEDDVAMLRRREQALFDKRAMAGGYALAAFTGGRWFSRTSVLLGGAERAMGRPEPRMGLGGDESSRADLTRDTKQALSYPLVSAALTRASGRRSDEALAASESLENAMRAAVEPLANLGGHSFAGVHPRTLEPIFERGPGGALVAFDELPTHARHLVAFAALAVRTLHAAWPDENAREAEGVVLIDDADLHLDASARRGLVPALREALPNVQWILSAASPEIALACAPGDILALRRMPESSEIRLYEGELAVVH